MNFNEMGRPAKELLYRSVAEATAKKIAESLKIRNTSLIRGFDEYLLLENRDFLDKVLNKFCIIRKRLIAKIIYKDIFNVSNNQISLPVTMGRRYINTISNMKALEKELGRKIPEIFGIKEMYIGLEME